jgi:hypothetical protein
MEDKLILLKRLHPVSYEVHRFEINQAKNLVLSTTSEHLAKKIVNSYNEYKPKKFISTTKWGHNRK